MARGVFVVSVGRSGSSAVARALNLLGLPLGAQEDLLQADRNNPLGYWESASLARLNDRLIDALEGSLDVPPDLEAGWTERPPVVALRAEAREIFETVYGDRSVWLWKDPRNSLLLPFWLGLIEVDAAVVLVHRNPLDVARSLQASNGLPKVHCLALWERYTKSALASSDGLPVFVASFENLLDNTPAWCEQASRFLDAICVPAAAGAVLGVEAFIDGKLARRTATKADLETDADLLSHQAALYASLEKMRGFCPGFQASEIVDLELSAWSSALFAERRRVNRLEGLIRYAEGVLRTR